MAMASSSQTVNVETRPGSSDLNYCIPRHSKVNTRKKVEEALQWALQHGFVLVSGFFLPMDANGTCGSTV